MLSYQIFPGLGGILRVQALLKEFEVMAYHVYRKGVYCACIRTQVGAVYRKALYRFGVLHGQSETHNAPIALTENQARVEFQVLHNFIYIFCYALIGEAIFS